MSKKKLTTYHYKVLQYFLENGNKVRYVEDFADYYNDSNHSKYKEALMDFIKWREVGGGRGNFYLLNDIDLDKHKGFREYCKKNRIPIKELLKNGKISKVKLPNKKELKDMLNIERHGISIGEHIKDMISEMQGIPSNLKNPLKKRTKKIMKRKIKENN